MKFKILLLLFAGLFIQQNISYAQNKPVLRKQYIQCMARLPYNDSPKLFLNFNAKNNDRIYIPKTKILLASMFNETTKELCIDTSTSVEFVSMTCAKTKEMNLKIKTDDDGFISIQCQLVD